MEPNIFCDNCGVSDWGPVRDGWKRCLTCGYLDTETPDRSCKVCGRPIGRFARSTMSVCVNCKGYQGEVIGGRCVTPFCGGKIQPGQKSEFCDGCFHEMNHWTKTNGPEWKRAAVRVFNEPTQLKTAHEQLKVTFPELSRYKVTEWIKRQTRLGILVKVEHGIYQTKEPEA